MLLQISHELADFHHCRTDGPCQKGADSQYNLISHMNLSSGTSFDLGALVFPALLFLYYVICWLRFARNPKIENIAPQYEPPAGISPGVARYVLTGGSDGTTLAAVLAELASKQVVSIEPEGTTYRIQLRNPKTTVPPDEAAAIKRLFDVDLPIQPYPLTKAALPVSQQNATSSLVISMANSMAAASVRLAPNMAVIDPRSPAIKSVVDGIQSAFRNNLQGVYFSWNFRFTGIGMLATFAWAMGKAMFLDAPPQASPMFVTFWLLFFCSVAGIVIGGTWISKPSHPTPAQRMQHILLPLLFFVLPGFLIYEFALPTAHSFVLAILISVALNNLFIVLMRAPTAEGIRLLQQLAGFREFLTRVEQDRLDRMNTPAQKAELMDRFLPYAIALNVKEGWGDKMAADLSNVIVER
jgi:Na+-transporting NADH:ubiquinone oxidoreductase subunit NqrD